MPGIHVRSLGKLDWVERGNEPVLTIPGAYWLCHKKHIYKFTFKWHKSLRNTEGFAYPKELTKVIRRIIKSQPRQGQQFGTRHLLVTYNHSPWMRQDKMFAMLKFRSRTDATAFPHAFVLTVQTLNDSSTDETSNRTKCTNVDTSKTNNGRISIDKETLITEGHSTQRKTDNSVVEFDKITSFDDQAAKTTLREYDCERRKDPGKRATLVKKSPHNMENHLLPRNKSRNRRGSTRHEKNKAVSLPDATKVEKGITADFADLPYQYIIEKEIEDSKGSPDKSDTMERYSLPGTSHREFEQPGKSFPRSPRSGYAADAPRSADITDLVMEGLMFTIRQDRDTVTVVEQKTKLEIDEVLENSEKAETKGGESCLLNSSLLRLENLITKIEMSESKSKCNDDTVGWSSRAMSNETMIAKSQSYISSNDCISSENGIRGATYDSSKMIGRNETPGKTKDSPCNSGTLARSPITEIPKIPLVKINLNNVRDVLSDKLRYDYRDKAPKIMEPGDQEMEIDSDIPLRDEEKNEMKNCVIEEEEEDEVGLELKYEEKDDCEVEKAEKEIDEQEKEEILLTEITETKQRDDELPKDESSRKIGSKLDETTAATNEYLKMAKSSPRVVSNEIVTVDQIPPALQKALGYKRFKQMQSSNDGEDENFLADKAATEMKEDTTIDDDCASKIVSVISPLNDRASSEKSYEKLVDTAANSTIDVTEEFQPQLNNENPRKQPVRRKSLRHAEQTVTNVFSTFNEEPEIRLDMWKFMRDMTRGAKVVVRRLDLTSIPNGIALGSSIGKYNAIQRYATES